MDTSTAEGSGDFVLMDPEERAASDRFTHDHIIPRIVSDWTRDKSLVNEWLLFANKHKPSIQVQEEMLDLYHNYRDKVIIPKDLALREVEIKRISYIIDRFHKLLAHRKEKSANKRKQLRLNDRIEAIHAAIASKDPSYQQDRHAKIKNSSNNHTNTSSGSIYGNKGYKQSNNHNRNNSSTSSNGADYEDDDDDDDDDNNDDYNNDASTTMAVVDFTNVDVSDMIITARQLEMELQWLKSKKWQSVDDKFKHRLFLPNLVASDLVR